MAFDPNLNRRSFLAAAPLASAAALGVVPAPGFAATHDGRALRAIHRFHLGSMRVTIVDDARFTFPAPMFAVNQPEGTVAPFLNRYGLPTEFVSLHMQLTYIETGPHKILLDTGMGDVTFPGNEPDNGRLLSSLASIGVAPEDITSVILSHGHPDHIGGCSKDGAPQFKNARYHMAPNEVEFWTQAPGPDQSFANLMLAVGNAQLEPIRALIEPYAAGDEIVPGVTAVAATGHTLGHHAFMLHDGADRLLHLMDTAVHYLVGPEEPDWALAVEMDPAAAAQSRRRLFKQAAEENLLVAGYHFPFPGIGRIISEGKAWRFVPMQTA